MDETTPDAALGTPPAEAATIDFEKADFDEPARDHVECGLCSRAIDVEYWQHLGKILCAACRTGVQTAAADARRGATFGKAFLMGGGVALACGAGYAIFVGVSNLQFALVTIGIGWAVGRSIQKVTRGFGGTRHQVLAVVLTYLGSTMGYLPPILKGFDESTHPMPAIFRFLIGLFVMLAAPFLEIADGFNGLLGILIIFFGLRTAWRVSKGVDAPISGPYRVAAIAA